MIQASIIIPCFNQLDQTRLCVSSLLRSTRRTWELIAIDNGSNDGTSAYFQGLHDSGVVPVRLVTNAVNRGFPAACNQGLALARGQYLVLLNNDTVVIEDWLDQLVALVESSPDMAMAGPMSNYVAPPQLVERVPYRDLAEMPAFARQWRREHFGRWFEVERLSGFCVLIKRRVYEQVGGLDESFGLGLFDDDDYSLRVRRAGWRLAVAKDLFIHHTGSQTFAGMGIDGESLLRENQARFEAKWGLRDFDKVARTVSIAPWASGGCEGEGAEAGVGSQERAKVSLTMIVRDEETNLPSCLGSVQGLFDEIVVVDTGSLDRTKEIALSFGARVFDFVWVQDFAAARNAALARATGDYAFWLDADDVIEADQRGVLEQLLRSLPKRQAEQKAYVVRCSCDPDREGAGGQTVVDHVRLFPLRERIRWTYRVHEQILPAIRACGVDVEWSKVTVRHTGYSDASVRLKKLARDEAILREELKERPNDPFVWFNIGSIAIERQDWLGSLDALNRSLVGSAPSDSIVRKLYALIARSHQMLGNIEQAMKTCSDGLSQDPDDAELLFRQGMLCRQVGRNADAKSLWERLLGLKRAEKFASVDMGIYGHITRRNLAILAEESGNLPEARKHWKGVLGELTNDAEATTALTRLGD